MGRLLRAPRGIVHKRRAAAADPRATTVIAGQRLRAAGDPRERVHNIPRASTVHTSISIRTMIYLLVPREVALSISILCLIR